MNGGLRAEGYCEPSLFAEIGSRGSGWEGVNQEPGGGMCVG
jgi:hypothetical protein